MCVDDDLVIQKFIEKPKDLAIINGFTISPTLKAKLGHTSTEKRCLASMGIYVFSRDMLR